MELTRRQALAAIAAPVIVRRLRASGAPLEITPGPFKGTRESRREWQVPEWYRDAKFGIWGRIGDCNPPPRPMTGILKATGSTNTL